MTRARRLALPVILIVAAGLTAGCAGSGERSLIDRFGEAQKSPDASAFTVADASLAGEQVRAIGVAPLAGSRLSWHVAVPARGWLWVSIGLRSDAWTQEGDGVTFTISASQNGTLTRLAEQRLEPFADSGDRKWFPLRISLAAFAGREIDLVLATSASPEGRPADDRNDFALWGEPQLVVR
jgi:hypothetical protein